jgi:Bacterial SH3 domain
MRVAQGFCLPMLAWAAACAKTAPPSPSPTVIHDTVLVAQTAARVDTVVDPDTRQRLSQMEADVLIREARIQILEEQLEDAQREVVRTMAKSQTVASKAEAASAIAEAELAVRTLRSAAGRNLPAEVPQAERMLKESNSEFEQGHFGGALYLASQARSTTARATDRIRRVEATDLLPGETAFDAPLRLQTTTRANIREGPGTSFRIMFTLDPESPLLGFSYVEGWVRITDDSGRSGWVARSLVDRR